MLLIFWRFVLCSATAAAATGYEETGDDVVGVLKMEEAEEEDDEEEEREQATCDVRHPTRAMARPTASHPLAFRRQRQQPKRAGWVNPNTQQNAILVTPLRPRFPLRFFGRGGGQIRNQCSNSFE